MTHRALAFLAFCSLTACAGPGPCESPQTGCERTAVSTALQSAACAPLEAEDSCIDDFEETCRQAAFSNCTVTAFRVASDDCLLAFANSLRACTAELPPAADAGDDGLGCLLAAACG